MFVFEEIGFQYEKYLQIGAKRRVALQEKQQLEVLS